MMQRKHSSEAMTGAPGALPGEAIRGFIFIVARQPSPPPTRWDFTRCFGRRWRPAMARDELFEVANGKHPASANFGNNRASSFADQVPQSLFRKTQRLRRALVV